MPLNDIEKMAEKTTRSAAQYLPRRITLPSLCKVAEGCRGCDLYKHATQTVFGQGPKTARLILVGEQPGDEEDKQGLPFVGPSGRLLDRALMEAGVPKKGVYVTNAVTHFKFTPTGKKRLHKTPSAREVAACVWAAAGLGATIGLGYYAFAFTGFSCILVLLVVFGWLMPMLGDRKDNRRK